MSYKHLEYTYCYELYSQKRRGISEEVASEHGTFAKLFLDAQDLVVLSEAVRTTRRAGLDFTSVKSAH